MMDDKTARFWFTNTIVTSSELLCSYLLDTQQILRRKAEESLFEIHAMQHDSSRNCHLR